MEWILEEMPIKNEDLATHYTAYEPSKFIIPSIKESLSIYQHSKCQLKITLPDGELCTCLEWSCTYSFIWSAREDNDRHYDIEIDLDDFTGDIQLGLKDVSDLSTGLKREYYEYCKWINNIRIDTPSSILFLIKNGIDAFDLIATGNAFKVK